MNVNRQSNWSIIRDTGVTIYNSYTYTKKIKIWVLRPFQEHFTYIEPIVNQRWAKTGVPGEKHVYNHLLYDVPFYYESPIFF